MAFFDQWNNVPALIEETNDGTVNVEDAGYLSVREQVERFIIAGINLHEYRELTHPSLYTEDENHLDPTVRPDYDFSDFQLDFTRLQKRMEERKAREDAYRSDLQNLKQEAEAHDAHRPQQEVAPEQAQPTGG